MNFHPVGMWETPRPPRAGGFFHISTGTALGFDSPVNCTGAHCCRPTSKRGSIAALVEGKGIEYFFAVGTIEAFDVAILLGFAFLNE